MLGSKVWAEKNLMENETVQSVSTNIIFSCVFIILSLGDAILLEGTVVVIAHHMSRVISVSLQGNCYFNMFSSIIFKA